MPDGTVPEPGGWNRFSLEVADLGATVFRHLGIDLSAQWTDGQGRPHSVLADGGRPIPELM